MRKIALIGCVAFAVGLASTVFAQGLTPKKVMQDIRQAYGKVQSLKGTVQVKTSGQTFVSTVQFQRPGRFVVEVKQDGNLMQSYTSDGKTYTTYNATDKSYLQQEVRADTPLIGGHLTFAGFTGLAMEPRFGEMLEGYIQQNFQKAQAKGTQKVGTVPCRVVELTGNEGTMTLFLGNTDGLVYRMVYKMSGGGTYEEMVTSLQVNPRIPQTAFAFKPPADAKKLEPKQMAEEQSQDTSALQGQDAPSFTLTDMEGNTVSLGDLKGKVVFLDFWATWCPPCRESLPHTQSLSQHEKAKSGDLVVLAVNAREEVDKVKQFMQEKGFTFRVLMDKDGAVLNAYKVQGIPTFVLIDRQGKVAWVQVGFGPGTEKQMEEAVNKLLAQ
ncbi:MAG: redoxin family protein [Chthonomonadetes bacterium]|nr:redoxin family protein [Chthonomonadetes bacterium]